MRSIVKSLRLWIDSSGMEATNSNNKIDLVRCLPFILTHLMCLGVFFVTFSVDALYVLLFTYAIRVFSLTAFYHRYFSHRAFKTSRVVQFVFAFIGASSAQRGPLWWSAHHRFHHKHSDSELDKHSPHTKGFFWSHCGWFLLDQNFKTDETFIKDLLKFPELKFIDRYDVIPPVFLAVVLYLWGGWQYLIWGYFVSTVLIYHVTFSINSLAHMFGKRTFETDDHSKNNWLLALLTFGEGWHNNHHYYPSSARHGFKWSQIDISYMLLKVLQQFRLVWDLRVYKPELTEPLPSPQVV